MIERPPATVLAGIAAVLVLSACGPGTGPKTEEAETMATRPIEAVLEEHTPRLMALAGVAGTYRGLREDGTPCIKVMVEELTPELRAEIPDTLEGHPVVVVETGRLGPR
jgi:hypothetical protein